ncbi:hypothetical protein IMZ48_49350 [Candidatus Bathyarchaeota archaeon]|nr:hypothetical protein [Candidatus Bathyarchaeota archaeon]
MTTPKGTGEPNTPKAPVRLAGVVNKAGSQEKKRAPGSHLPVHKGGAHKKHQQVSEQGTRDKARASEKPSSPQDMGAKAGVGLSAPAAPRVTFFPPYRRGKDAAQ